MHNPCHGFKKRRNEAISMSFFTSVRVHPRVSLIEVCWNDEWTAVGDMAYNMDTDNARVGDDYMKAIESVAAYVPYMTCPGNHENA